jgi:hypothetical protein
MAKGSSIARMLCATVIVGAALCVPSSVVNAGVQNGGCKVTGGGTQGYGVNAHLEVSAHWDGASQYSGNVTLTTPAGDVYQFNVTFLFCGHDGGGGPGAPNDGSPGDANIANFEGYGKKNGVPGYDYAVTLHDHGEGVTGNHLENPDEFAIQVERTADQVIVEHYAGAILGGGNFQVQT